MQVKIDQDELEEENVSAESVKNFENQNSSSTIFLADSKSVIDAKGIVSLASSTYIMAFVGDIGISSSSRAVLSLIKKDASAAVLLGDFDYADRPDYWKTILDQELGPTYPLIFVMGNHDENKWATYLADIKDHLSRTPDIKCTGTLGTMSLCSYKDTRVIVTAPGMDSLGRQSQIYTDYILKIGKVLNDDTWNICAWHKNQQLMQIGDKTDEVGWGPYTACNTLGFPVMTGHEHSYARSFVFSDVAKQITIPHEQVSVVKNIGIAEDHKVDFLSIAPGKTFVTVSGIGGHSIRVQKRNGPWWSAIDSATQGAQFGALFCAFNYAGNSKQALCYFKNINGEVKDMFVVGR